MQSERQNVGIIGMDIYFPHEYVCQKQYEKYNKVSEGKYTIGLGQQNMSFTKEYEDVNSISMTLLYNLMRKYNIKEKEIGRIEVGTETILDKSKSVKTHLMSLFQNNKDIEGVMSINACYGGTAALFNSIAWMQSDMNYNNLYSIVIMTDIAKYANGNARPTGGAGGIILLLGYNADIIINNIKSSHFDNNYDFYKPVPNSPYPVVNGVESINCYLNSLQQCYELLSSKMFQQNKTNISVQYFDYLLFHTPYSKMVQKSFNKLLYLDIINNKSSLSQQYQQLFSQQQYSSSQLQSQLNQIATPIFNAKTLPSLYFSKNLGNIYTGALYGCLISLISDNNVDLKGKKLLAFSYGSGSTASMFVIDIKSNLENIRSKLDCRQKLQQRNQVDPHIYTQLMQKQEDNYNNMNKVKIDHSCMNLFDNTFYLDSIDDKYRRTYKLFNKNIDNSKQIAAQRLNSLKNQLIQN